jgi:hypothetical protein
MEGAGEMEIYQDGLDLKLGLWKVIKSKRVALELESHSWT